MTTNQQSSGQDMKKEYQEGEKEPWIARLGSILIPGFGHIYVGRAAEGVFWTFLTFLTYIFIVGILIHVYLIYNAGKLVEMHNEGKDDLIYEDVADELET